MTRKRRRTTRQAAADTETLDWDGTDTQATATAAATDGAEDGTQAGAGTDSAPGRQNAEIGVADDTIGAPEGGDTRPSPSARRGLLNLDRVVGLVAATAIGDALGWPQENRSQIIGGDAARNVQPRPEFRDWERSAGSQYGRYTDPVFAGEYSDDTQLMLAVARACHHRDWFNWLTRVELPFWPIYQRGGGGAVLTASRSWGEGRSPWMAPSTSSSQGSRSHDRVARYFDAGANGVAMRIAPHVIVTAHDPDENFLIRRVIADGITTHGHPRALLGGVIHALALRYALRHQSTLGYGELLDHLRGNPVWRDPSHFMESLPPGWADAHADRSRGDTRQPPAFLWSRTCEEVEQLLNIAIGGLSQGATANDQRTLTDLGVYDKDRSGAGTVTAVAAAYVAARTASRPMGGLLRSGFLRNADTDTLCSMTGALLGATQGTGWLNPLLGRVQDRDHLISVATSLAAIGDGAAGTSGSPDVKPPTAGSMRRWSKNVFDGDPIDLAPDGRAVKVQRISPLQTRTRQFMARAVLLVEDGQTLIVDRTSKTPIPTVRDNRASRDTDSDRGSKSGLDSDLGRDQADRGAPAAGSTIAAVELRVTDVARTAEFLQHVFGLQVQTRPNNRADVGNLILLSQSHHAELSVGAAPVLHVHSHNLSGAAVRAEGIDGAAVQWTDEDRCLWIREPGGLRIRVTTS